MIERLKAIRDGDDLVSLVFECFRQRLPEHLTVLYQEDPLGGVRPARVPNLHQSLVRHIVCVSHFPPARRYSPLGRMTGVTSSRE